MRKILYILLMVVAVGCVKVDIYNTDHPLKGKLTLNTDWSNRTAGVNIPADYIAEYGTTKVTLSGTTVEYPNLLESGVYTFNLYNISDKITITGNIAAAAADGLGVTAMPGWQFFGLLTKAIEKDSDYTETVVMQQVVRQLNFELNIAEGDVQRIKSIYTTMSGITSSWDCVSKSPIGTPTTIVPIFTIKDNKLLATVRLLGVVGNKQELTINLTFNDEKKQTLVSDITAQLVNFNNDKILPMTLTGNVNTPVGTINSGTITDWVVVESNGSATEPTVKTIAHKVI